MTFIPEHQQAGLSITHYFPEVVQQLNPNLPVALQVTQQDLEMSINLITREETLPELEKILNGYTQIIGGQLGAKALFDEEQHRVQLNQMMVRAKLELRHMVEWLHGGPKKTPSKLVDLHFEQLRQTLAKGLAGPWGVNQGAVRGILDMRRQLESKGRQEFMGVMTVLQRQLHQGIDQNGLALVQSAMGRLFQQSPVLSRQLARLLLNEKMIQGSEGKALREWMKKSYT